MSDADCSPIKISAENFEKLMFQIKTEPDSGKRSALGKSLSEILLQPNGFNAYFDYLSSNSVDNIECMNLFCKVVLTKPSLFSSDIEYLLHVKKNFSDIIEHFLQRDEDQNLQILMTKIFYFLRRNQNEGMFDFFFDTLIDSPNDLDLLMFNKLCKWKFYPEELCEIYFRQFKKNLNNYLNIQSSSGIIIETLKLACSYIAFESLLSLFSEIGNQNIIKFMSLWANSEIPRHCVESAIVASFPGNDILLFLTGELEKFTFSEKFKTALKQRSETVTFETHDWKKFINTDNLEFDAKSKIIASSSMSIEEIRKNIASENPTDIAFGMHSIRQMINANPNSIIGLEILNPLINCLFYDESFVYMNSIKTCVCMGKVDTSLVCDTLIKTAKSRINLENVSFLLRFVEIFDSLLVEMKNKSAPLSPWTELFSCFCAKYISCEVFELECSIINYYTNILIYDHYSFIKNQRYLWNAFNLSSKVFSSSDLEIEAFFKLIDTYLSVIDSNGRSLAEDSVLFELHNFLRRSLASASPQISVMAYHNILNLEKIRKPK